MDVVIESRVPFRLTSRSSLVRRLRRQARRALRNLGPEHRRGTLLVTSCPLNLKDLEVMVMVNVNPPRNRVGKKKRGWVSTYDEWGMGKVE